MSSAPPGQGAFPECGSLQAASKWVGAMVTLSAQCRYDGSTSRGTAVPAPFPASVPSSFPPARTPIHLSPTGNLPPEFGAASVIFDKNVWQYFHALCAMIPR